MVQLKAKKLPRYRGKALVAGDPFNATRAHARVLIAAGLAEPVLGTYSAPRPARVTKAAKQSSDAKPAAGSRRAAPSPELVQARADYKTATGKNWFSGWSVAELRAKIAAAKG